MESSTLAYPLVSVIIPIYNAEKYIADTINSVINQTYRHLEIIIVDDGSTDFTRKKIQELRPARQLQFIQQNNLGAAAARNKGYQVSTGAFIKFLDGDDLMNPTMIEQQVELALLNYNCLISSAWGRFYHDDLNTFTLSTEECWQSLPSAEWICTSWKNAQPMTNPGIFLVPRNVIEKAGLWNESLSLLDDKEYFTRTILTSERVIFSHESVLYYRSGLQGSLSGTSTYKAMQSAFHSIEAANAYLLSVKIDYEAKLSCANAWQNFIYDIYPEHQDLIQKAEQHIANLVKPTLSFPRGGYTRLLVSVLGWKLTKKLKYLCNY